MKNFGGTKSKRFCNKRKRDLASFVYNCIDEGYVGNNQKGNCKFLKLFVNFFFRLTLGI